MTGCSQVQSSSSGDNSGTPFLRSSRSISVGRSGSIWKARSGLSAQPEPRRPPEANEFSPGQVELGRTLELAAAPPGDRDGIVEAIREEGFQGRHRGHTTEEED